MKQLFVLVTAATAVLSPGPSSATLIVKGDVTTGLLGDLFIDAASVGNSDTDAAGYPPAFVRAFNLTGSNTAPGVPGVVTMYGFGFATPNANNSASKVRLTFTYLGADNSVGGADDVIVGDTSFDWNNGAAAGGWNGNGEYYVNFDVAGRPSAVIDGLGSTFRIAIEAFNGGNVQFKTLGTGSSQAKMDGAKFSFSGTFAAIPEPLSMLFYGGLGCVVAAMRRRTQPA